MLTPIIYSQQATERNLDNEGPHSDTPTDTDFKGKQSKKALMHILCKYRINGNLKEKK